MRHARPHAANASRQRRHQPEGPPGPSLPCSFLSGVSSGTSLPCSAPSGQSVYQPENCGRPSLPSRDASPSSSSSFSPSSSSGECGLDRPAAGEKVWHGSPLDHIYLDLSCWQQLHVKIAVSRSHCPFFATWRRSVGPRANLHDRLNVSTQTTRHAAAEDQQMDRVF